jgi:hypothetical protein
MAERAFIIMQVGVKDSFERKRADEIYKFIIAPAVIDAGLDPYRADQDLTPGSITPKFLSELLNARLVIADLTGRNPNVFYELGITHSFLRPLISIADTVDSLPFDAKDERVIELGEYPPGGLTYAQGEQAKTALQKSLRIVLADSYVPSSPLREVAAANAPAPEPPKYDAFISSPMFAFGDEGRYLDHRSNVIRLTKTLHEQCGFTCYYAGEGRENYDEFETGDIALSNDLQALRDSRFYVLLIPETSATSALVEAGAALILRKPSTYFVQREARLPFALEHATNTGDAQLPRIKIYAYSTIEDLLRMVAVNKQGLFM